MGWRALIHVLCINKHDEMIVEARDAIEDQVEAIVKESMETAFEQIIPEIQFVVEIRVVEAWKG